MSAKKLAPYRRKIQRITKCSAEDTTKIEQSMRDDVLHTVALDWLSPARFREAALEAARLLDTNRVDYEEYFARTRAIYDELKATRAANT
jgi:ribosomal protein L16/L10AE